MYPVYVTYQVCVLNAWPYHALMYIMSSIVMLSFEFFWQVHGLLFGVDLMMYQHVSPIGPYEHGRMKTYVETIRTSLHKDKNTRDDLK